MITSYFWIDGQIAIHVNARMSVDQVNYARMFHRKPCAQVYTTFAGTSTVRAGYFTYLGFKNLGVDRLPKRMRTQLLIMGVVL